MPWYASDTTPMAIRRMAMTRSPLFMRPLSKAGGVAPGFAVLVALLDDFPVDVVEEGRDVIGTAAGSVVDHERVLEDVHHQDRVEPGRMALLVARDPAVEQPAGGGIVVEDGPAHSAHAGGPGEVLPPRADRAPGRPRVGGEVAAGGELRAGREVAEVVLV